MKLTHEYNEDGNFHRISATMQDGRVHNGSYAGYQGIAVLTVNGNGYIAVTDYHGGTLTLHPNTIYQVSKVSK